MKKNNTLEDFNLLGKEYQMNVAKALIEDKDFFYTNVGDIDSSIFTDDKIRMIVEIILNHYTKNGVQPTYKVIEWELKSISSDNDIVDVKDTFQSIKDMNFENLSYTKESATEIIKRLKVKKVLQEALSKQSKKYDIEQLSDSVYQIQKIMVPPNTTNMINPAEFLDSDYDGTINTKVPTGIDELDVNMNGGLKKSTLGLLIAGSSFGKTTLSSIIACNMLYYGYNVLHIFFEDTDKEIAYKYYATLTGEYSNEFEKPEVRKKYQAKIFENIPRDKWTKNLKLKRMDDGETTVEDIRALMNHYEYQENWKPDAVIIDYLSCLRTTSNEKLRAEQSWQMETRMVKRIAALAAEKNVAIWLCQQTNRDGLKAISANNKMANVQGSSASYQSASAVLYLDRCGCERNYANLSLVKMRGGMPQDWQNIYLNNGTCQIDLSDVIKSDPTFEYNE